MGNCVGGKGSKKDPTILTEEEIKLLLDNTKLSLSQIRALHHNFLKECPSGKLTKKDFIKLFKEVHPSENKKEKADKFCEYVFKVIDRDNLGYISFQDFVLCFSLTSYGDFRQKCEFAFKLYDLDKDGKISKKEMTQVLEALYDLSGITDRKGDKAPAKIVEDIIKKLNQQKPAPAPAPVEAAPVAAEPAPAAEPPKEEAADASAPAAESPKEEAAAAQAEAEPPKEAAAAEAPKDSKKDKKDKGNKDKKPKERATKESKPKAEAKSAKPAKPAKQPDYITKEQFIEACNTDEAIKKLFVDSIFASQAEAADEVAEVKVDAEPKIVVETNTTLDSDQNQEVVTNTITVDLHDQAASESTTVVNRSEVVITEAEPEQAQQTNNSEPQPDKTPVAEINQVVEEINNEANAESAPTSNETESEQNPPQQVEENSTDKNAQPQEQPKPAAEASQSNAEEAK